MYTGSDRRLFPRSDGEFIVRYSLSGESIEHNTTTKNISGRGMRITVSEELTPGTILDLEIFRKNSNISARGKGEVVWVDTVLIKDKEAFNAGVKFIDLNFLYIASLINELKS